MVRRLAPFACIPFVLGTGCSLKLQRTPQPPAAKSGVYTEPVGDGSHYIEVVTEPKVPPVAVRGKWRRTATRVCEGDYLVMSEVASERRRGPLVEGRVYEGWVRCISPEVTVDETKEKAEAKRDAAAEPKRTPLFQRLPRLGG